MNESQYPLLVIGAGSHSKVLIDALQTLRRTLLGVVDPNPPQPQILGVPVLGDDTVVLQHAPDSVFLVNGLGSTKDLSLRVKIYEQFKAQGYRFTTVVHPSAWVSKHTKLGEGAQIMAKAVVQTGVQIGANSIVNTAATLDHDCVIEPHCHVAPGVTLSGSVQVGTQSHLGTGATVIQGIHIGKRCLVAAGAVVVQPVLDRTTVYGIPASPKPS